MKAHAIENDIIKAYNEKLRCHNSAAETFILNAIESLPEEVCFPRLDLSFAVKNNNVFYEPEKPETGKITFYKARESKVDIPSMDMSFIPFEKRALVSDGRFSSVGVPCLYLANSTAVCFKEFDKSKIHTPSEYLKTMSNYCYSCFDISSLDDHRILDLTYNLSFIESFFDAAYNKEIKHDPREMKLLPTTFPKNDPKHKSIDWHWWNLIKYFYIRIIVIATSFVAPKRKRNFKPEYVIPQLIMDALCDKRSDVIGVAYMSLRISTKHSDLRAVNLAFPNFQECPGVEVKNSRGYAFGSVLLYRSNIHLVGNPSREYHSLTYVDYYPLKSLVHRQNKTFFVNARSPQKPGFFKKGLGASTRIVIPFVERMEDDFIFLDDYLVDKANHSIELYLN